MLNASGLFFLYVTDIMAQPCIMLSKDKNGLTKPLPPLAPIKLVWKMKRSLFTKGKR